MKSTLLFVAVLLACTPVHGQTIGPIEAPVLHFWLAGVLPTTAAEPGETKIAKRRRPAHKAVVVSGRDALRVDTPRAELVVETTATDFLLHSPNAP